MSLTEEDKQWLLENFATKLELETVELRLGWIEASREPEDEFRELTTNNVVQTSETLRAHIESDVKFQELIANQIIEIYDAIRARLEPVDKLQQAIADQVIKISETLWPTN